MLPRATRISTSLGHGWTGTIIRSLTSDDTSKKHFVCDDTSIAKEIAAIEISPTPLSIYSEPARCLYLTFGVDPGLADTTDWSFAAWAVKRNLAVRWLKHSYLTFCFDSKSPTSFWIRSPSYIAMALRAGSLSRQELQPEQILEACASVGRNLGDIKYAIVGGAACLVLGSTRSTEDVDFVVLKGEISNARKLLSADKDSFTVDSRTLHTYHKSSPPVQIEILAPPGTFREKFDQDTPTLTVEIGSSSVIILHPTLILNAKCRSVLGRASDAKKRSDASDIKFLLRYLVRTGIIPSSQDLSNASKTFVEWFVATFAPRRLADIPEYEHLRAKAVLPAARVLSFKVGLPRKVRMLTAGPVFNKDVTTNDINNDMTTHLCLTPSGWRFTLRSEPLRSNWSSSMNVVDIS
nr:hypothetical protein CFP56_52883 [Quercus suber]